MVLSHAARTFADNSPSAGQSASTWSPTFISSFLSRLRGAGAAAGGLRLRGAAGVGASLVAAFGLLRLGGGATGVDASLPRLRCGGGDDLAALAGRALSCLMALLGASGSGDAALAATACDCSKLALMASRRLAMLHWPRNELAITNQGELAAKKKGRPPRGSDVF